MSPVDFPVAPAAEISFIFADVKGRSGGVRCLVSSMRRA
jgi:hypothetical protein